MAGDRETQLARYLGPLELRIMTDVWEHGPSTVNDVLERLNASPGRPLAYNTVMSTLARLADKDHLDRTRQGRAYVYAGEGPDAFLRAQAEKATRDLIDGFGDAAVAGIIDGFDVDDDTRRLMREVLDRSNADRAPES